MSCSQCGKPITDNYYCNYYASQYEPENILCGEGDCWAEWMQIYTYEFNQEGENENE